MARNSPSATPGQRLMHIGWDITERGCWEWRGARSLGYGTVNYKGKTVKAHRLSYETWVGPIPEGLLVRHKCDNKACIFPDHLEVGTHRDNTLDAVRRGRWLRPKTEGNPLTKLTWANVREIRGLAGTVPQRELARRFGVSQSNIRAVIHNKTWREPQEVGTA